MPEGSSKCQGYRSRTGPVAAPGFARGSVAEMRLPRAGSSYGTRCAESVEGDVSPTWVATHPKEREIE